MTPRDWMGGTVKPLVFGVCLVPFAWLLWRIAHDDLGTNPIETLNRFTGDWTLRFLLITLAVTPLRRLTGWHQLMRLRRMIGLFAFFYACLHFLSYALIDQYFNLPEILKDIAKRPYITVGFASFVLLIPLALTSTHAMVRRLGGRRWQQLHRLVYVIAVGGVIHFLWLVKSDIREPALYAALLALLLGYRLWWELRAPARSASAQR
jgi:sulfoxide reductase heme-binding subunit YedZ